MSEQRSDATEQAVAARYFATLPWAQVEAVAVRTTADGPWAEDVFWVVAFDDSDPDVRGEVTVPGSWVQGESYDALMARLPGLDLQRVIWAMASAEPRTFCVWRHDRSPQQADDDGLVARFVAVVARAGGDALAAEPLARALLMAWSAPERRYHERQHLCDCLFELDALRADADATVAGLAAAPAVELALWYHDVVYDTHVHDNEERSALRLVAEVESVGVEAEVVATAARLVRATAHLGRPADAVLAPDEALVVDIDLSILGQHPLRFADFEDGIGEEYAHVPTIALRWNRRRFLRRLQAAAQIFATPTMRARHEAAARTNLGALLASSRYALWGMWS